MEPTENSHKLRNLFRRWDGVLLGCLLILPYFSYGALVAGGILTIVLCVRQRKAVGSLLYRQGWLLIMLGMLLTVAWAQYPVEAALQLANFLPFMVFFAGVAVSLPRLGAPMATLERWASALLTASIPLNLRAIVEYLLRSPQLTEQLGPMEWLYGPVYYGHRADSVFGHPNVLAGYLVMLLGLGLGLSLKFLKDPVSRQAGIWWQRPAWIYSATGLTLVGLFCSGSRNGVLVAIAQLLCFGWLMRRNRVVLFTGLGAIAAVCASTVMWGIGGRSIVEAFSTITLRVGVWQLAVDMIRQHPWLGTGLGSYKLLYVPYAVAEYDVVEHAHNLWLMLAAEVGIPLMLGLTLVVGGICWRGVRHLIRPEFSTAERCVLTGYLLGFVGCSLFALFDLTFYDARVNFLGWLLLGVIQGIPQLRHPPTKTD